MDSSNERITLRLQKENVDALDAFLKESEEFRSRSELCRTALDKYIREKSEELKPKGRDIRIKVPGKHVELMERLVEDGYYISIEFIINKLIDEHFTLENLEYLEQRKTEMDKATGKPTITLGDREELIPR
jgi:Arc/MetJ-type ribon-helix-helix transcriptional regulator